MEQARTAAGELKATMRIYTRLSESCHAGAYGRRTRAAGVGAEDGRHGQAGAAGNEVRISDSVEGGSSWADGGSILSQADGRTAG